MNVQVSTTGKSRRVSAGPNKGISGGRGLLPYILPLHDGVMYVYNIYMTMKRVRKEKKLKRRKMRRGGGSRGNGGARYTILIEGGAGH